jgi:hypothetical protein
LVGCCILLFQFDDISASFSGLKQKCADCKTLMFWGVFTDGMKDDNDINIVLTLL